jgi:glycosyltransferase involved in cell wall biosynthesis
LIEGAPSNVIFLGDVADDELRWLYTNCHALIAPANEDFGLTPIEAASFGKPSLTLRYGGYLDSTVEGVTGYYFDNLEAESILSSINMLETQPLEPASILRHASSFAEERFIQVLRQKVGEVLESRMA